MGRHLGSSLAALNPRCMAVRSSKHLKIENNEHYLVAESIHVKSILINRLTSEID